MDNQNLYVSNFPLLSSIFEHIKTVLHIFLQSEKYLQLIFNYMKKITSILLLIIPLLSFSVFQVSADVVQLRFNAAFSSVASKAFSTTDVLYAVDAATMSTSTSNVVFPSPNNYRVQLKTIVLELKSTSASAIKVYGMSSGSSSTRSIYQVSVADSYAGTYTLLDDCTLPGTKITSNITGQSVSTSESVVTGLNIAQGKFVKISFCTSNTSTTTQNVNISGFDITPALPVAPSIKTFTAEGVTATINEDAKTITALLPYGSNLTSITPVVTLGGTATSYSPTGAQNFSGGAVTYTASDATTSVNYAVTLTVPATVPAPTIALTSGSASQALKAGGNLVNIVYNLTNATGATVLHLPDGLSGNFVSTGTNSGNYTISGTVQSGVTPGTFDFTVTATAIAGYSGPDITTTGTVKVKSSTAGDILYMIGSSTLPSTDALYPYLDANTNLLLTLKTAASTAPASTFYDDYDLIIVHESVAGGNAELNALKAVNKPILNFKSFEYNTGRWVWGTADNGLSTNLSITVKQPSHPIFNGISEAVLNATLDLLSAVSGSKGIQPADITLPGSINVATAPKAGGTAAVAIHDVPGAVRGAGITAKYLMIPVFADSYQNLTATAKTMVSNAVDYLLNGTQFTAPSLQISSLTAEGINGTIDHTAGTIDVKVPIGTDRTAITPVITLEGVGTTVTPLTAQNFTASAVNYTVSDMINSKVYAVSVNENSTSTVHQSEGPVFDGKTVINPSHAEIQMFDTSGRRILSSINDIDLSTFKNGIYIFRMQNKILKVTLIK